MLLKEYQKVLKFLNLRAPVSIQVPFLLILPKSQVHCWFLLSWVAKPSYQGVLGSLIWSAETSTHGIKLGSVTREERSKRHYYFPLLRLKVSLEIKAQIVMIPKAGDTVKKKIPDTARVRYTASKNLSASPHPSEHMGGPGLPEEIKGWPRVCTDTINPLWTEDKSIMPGTDDRICSNHFHLPW